jgi:hypothetical protein
MRSLCGSAQLLAKQGRADVQEQVRFALQRGVLLATSRPTDRVHWPEIEGIAQAVLERTTPTRDDVGEVILSIPVEVIEKHRLREDLRSRGAQSELMFVTGPRSAGARLPCLRLWQGSRTAQRVKPVRLCLPEILARLQSR